MKISRAQESGLCFIFHSSQHSFSHSWTQAFIGPLLGHTSIHLCGFVVLGEELKFFIWLLFLWFTIMLLKHKCNEKAVCGLNCGGGLLEWISIRSCSKIKECFLSLKSLIHSVVGQMIIFKKKSDLEIAIYLILNL